MGIKLQSLIDRMDSKSSSEILDLAISTPTKDSLMGANLDQLSATMYAYDLSDWLSPEEIYEVFLHHHIEAI